MRKLFAVLLIGFLPIPLFAQQAAPKQSEELQTLNWMVGCWEGESWIEFAPGQRRTNRSLETVQSKVGGAVLLIEGYHATISDLPGGASKGWSPSSSQIAL
jgi:hypothetical protein